VETTQVSGLKENYSTNSASCNIKLKIVE